MAQIRALMWFRGDLRVRDNPALVAACRAADQGVVAVFTICPEQWQQHDWAPVKVDLLLRQLRDLSDSLAELSIPLKIMDEPLFAGVPARLLALAQKSGCDGIWFNEEYEINERLRDDEVCRLFREDGRTAECFMDQVLVAPGEVLTGQGRYYTVFTPFKKRWYAILRESGVPASLHRPRAQEPTELASDPIPEELPSFDGLRRPDLWPSGEDHAHKRLQKFVRQRVSAYSEARDFPSRNGTSTVSPYLTLGILSPRQCLHAALAANEGRLDQGDSGVVTWISELVWREFYRHVLVGFPRVCKHQCFDLKTRSVEWRDDPEAFERWKEGRTGIPLVDAAMRQLRQTGWMHNRLRMVAAMFLSKNLFLDWRLGERYFMRSLVDGDLASNNGGWQWSASVGTDAAPYFRVFNPVRQSERFDPEGALLRKFLPELESLDDRAIHFPAERAQLLAGNLGYPEPLVDLKSSRQRAIERFRAGLERS